MTDKTILRRRDEIVTASMDGETVMMSIETGKYYNLGAIGGGIWALLDTEKSFAQIIDALTEKYEVDRAQCEADTAVFLEQLGAQGLLTIHERETGA
jgi:hypothetical protein